MADRKSSTSGGNRRRNLRSDKDPSKQSNQEDKATCDTCKTIFTDENDKLLRCTWCEEGWRCIKCLGYTDNQYDFLSKDENMLFCCANCKDPVVNQKQDDALQTQLTNFMSDMSNKFDKLLESLGNKVDRDEFDGLKKQVEGLETQVSSGNKQIADLNNKLDQTNEDLAKQIDERFDEARERDQRSYNLIIYEVVEASGQAEKRKEADEKEVARRFEELLPKNEIKIDGVYRLGKYQGGDEDEDENAVKPKPRPVKVVLQSRKDKDLLIRKLTQQRKNNPDKVKHIKMSSDRTKQERDQYKKLRQELEDRTNNGEENLYIRGDKVLQRTPRQQQK